MSHYFIDLFCGAGGVTTGASRAGAKVIACVNHDPKAIQSHEMNHPDVLHFTEDIRTLDIAPLCSLVNRVRIEDPNAVINLWASLECTNFSKAKGGQPRDADSRTLADHLFRYIEGLNPDKIWIENVEEFMSWGPLNKFGKPVSRKEGSDYVRWCNSVQSHGYDFDWKILDSADYGAFTSRKRFFAQFTKPGIAIKWPVATHAKKPSNGMFGELKKWKPVKEILDFADEGGSIFGRKKDLSEKTLERIYAGLVKYVAGGLYVNDHINNIQAKFLLKYNSTNGKTGVHHPPSIDDPAPVISCQGRLGLVSPHFIAAYHGNGHNCHSIHNPSPTVMAADALALVQTKWIDRNFSGGGQHSSINAPCGSVLSVPKLNLVQTKFIVDTQFNNGPASIDDPSRTITANRKHHYLVNPQFNSKGGDINAPCFTLIARMDKAPPYIVCAENGDLSIEVLQTDSPCTVKIKKFMAAYGIVDIKMRMLRIHELLRIQGFPANYKLVGNQADQKKFIGNAVEVNTAHALIAANINSHRLQQVAA